jgi:hypothetical protein
LVTHVLLAAHDVLFPQLTGLVPQPDGTAIAQG